MFHSCHIDTIATHLFAHADHTYVRTYARTTKTSETYYAQKKESNANKIERLVVKYIISVDSNLLATINIYKYNFLKG